MGNSLWRLQTTLNFTAKKVFEIGREKEVEIIVTDWGSDVPLREVLELSKEAAQLVSFLFVPPTIAKELQKDSPFPEVLALNAAARRASGDYIGRIDQDTLAGKRFLQYFFSLYEGKESLEIPLTSALMFANRKSIPYQFAVKYPPIGMIEKFIKLFGSSLKILITNKVTNNLFWTSYVGIWLIHKDIWETCQGYDERLIYYNWMETEMIMRLSAFHPVINLGKKTNFDFYHLEHYTPTSHFPKRPHEIKNPKAKILMPSKNLQPNNPDWGLFQYPLELMPISAEKVSLPWKTSPLKEWSSLIGLIVISGIQMVRDEVLFAGYKTVQLGKTGFHKLLTLRKALEGHSLIQWPGLIIQLFNGRKAKHR
jgi:hypothetical protein